MAPTLSPERTGVGALLREWRLRRRLSQLELASTAEVSARHLSFVETGRSKPSRELLLHLADHLDVPLRERNTLLLAAGYAPAYGERSLGDDEMDPVRDALDRVLRAHEPYPAVIVDRHWELVAANGPALTLFTAGVAPWLLEPPVNVYRLGLHPEGLAPRVRNLPQYSHHLLTRLQREAALSGDPVLAALLAEVRAYPGLVPPSPVGPDPARMLYLPMELTTADGRDLSFFSTIATFGTPLDVTVAELSIEAFFPADARTRAALQGPAPPEG
ncbi:MAG: transcriptional regulator [Acidimicrobiia bacterium]|nr:MAG: transcriptional regulator [Acidimicrobiia bacterium]